MVEETNIHATCVTLGARGVLLIGPTGSGKSELALRLMDEGAKLVADDRSILFVRNGALHARAPASIRGLLEIRGVGIVQVAAKRDAHVVLAVRLGADDARLPRPRLYRKLGCEVPEIRLDGHRAASPAKIRAALAAFAQGRFRDTFHLK